MNKPLLLILVGLLLVVKLVVLPLLEWQDGLSNEIEQQHNRLLKTENAVNNIDAYTAQNAVLESSIAQLESAFYKDTGDIKISTQRQFEDLVKQHSLDLDNFNWLLEEAGELSQFTFVVTIKGKLDDFIALQFALAELEPILLLQEITVRRNNSSRRSIEQDKLSAKLTLKFISQQVTETTNEGEGA